MNDEEILSVAKRIRFCFRGEEGICLDSIKKYMRFVRPYILQIVATVIIGLVKFGIPLIIPLLLKYILDDVIGATGLSMSEKTDQLLMVMGIVAFIFLVVRPPIEYYRQYFAQWIGSKILYDIRDVLFAHIQKLSLRYYSNAKTGEIISRVINDVEQTKNFVITGLMNVWLDLATIVIAIIIMLNMNVKLSIVALIALPFYMISVKYFYSKLRVLTRERSQALGEMQGYLHEKIAGITVTKSFALEDHEQEQFNKKNSSFLQKALQHTRWNAKTFSVVNTITDIAPLLVITYSGYLVIHGQLSVGAMVAFIAYLDRLYDPLRRLVTSSTTLTQSLASMDRVFEFLDEKYDIQDKPNAIKVDDFQGDITFDNVQFRYNEKDEDVLKNISLEIKAGEKIALVGGSGGGKSTIVSLISRFYDVTKGAIYIDNFDLREYEIFSLRNNIGMVLQDPILFSDTVFENIRYGKPGATEEEIYEAAKKANAHEFIQDLANGYETLVGERGVKLSGGQKQRIAIARVFLKNPSILIFDEATSALDLENEKYIQMAMDKLAVGRTTIIIAHRLSTITHVDRIVFLEKGEIKETGTHVQLMNQKGSYYDLFQIQNLESKEESGTVV